MFKIVRFTKSRSTLLFTLGGVALLFFAGASGFFFWKYTSSKDAAETNSVTTEQTSAGIISKVNKIYKLPAGEEPTVAAVQDTAKLTGQAFFKDAHNGDYLLVYKKAQVALLYRQGENRLINVGPISLEGDQAGQTAGASTKN